MLLLFRALRDRLGFTRLRSAATGGAALGPDTFRFFQALGVPLRQLYGQTEMLGAYTIHRATTSTSIRWASPSTPASRSASTTPDANGLGEIVARHPNMFLGYYGIAAHRRDLRDGWLHTGDAGYFDADGPPGRHRPREGPRHHRRRHRFSPQYIENKLKFSPYVAEAVVLGDGAPLSRGDGLHPLPDRRQMGGAAAHRLHHLHRPGGQARGLRPVRARSRR